MPDKTVEQLNELFDSLRRQITFPSGQNHIANEIRLL
jgi:hypothetical protein